MNNINEYYRQNRAAAQAVLNAWEQINASPINVEAFLEADIPADVKDRVEAVTGFGRSVCGVPARRYQLAQAQILIEIANARMAI